MQYRRRGASNPWSADAGIFSSTSRATTFSFSHLFWPVTITRSIDGTSSIFSIFVCGFLEDATIDHYDDHWTPVLSILVHLHPFTEQRSKYTSKQPFNYHSEYIRPTFHFSNFPVFFMCHPQSESLSAHQLTEQQVYLWRTIQTSHIFLPTYRHIANSQTH